MEISSEIYNIFNILHQNPELSGYEYKTENFLINFIQENTDFEIHKLSGGFYCAYRYNQEPAIAFRADYDAVSSEGTAKHLCGHDGHSASLCAVALEVYRKKPQQNVIFLFQSAEETGKGAIDCCHLFEHENISAIYGAHNLPGYPLGQVLTRYGTFALGSMGIELKLTGKPAHAAYPENGISPANAVGRLLTAFSNITDDAIFKNFCLCTIIGTQLGEKAFGVAPADARIWLTIRSESQRELFLLKEKIESYALEICHQEQLSFSAKYYDEFPATENHANHVNHILSACNGKILPAPMRWSEDFGHYLFHCPGAFFGIGAGIDCPNLHTEQYHYPVELLAKTASTLLALLEFHQHRRLL